MKRNNHPWAAVIGLSILCFVLVASEFMPVSLLTPIAKDLAISEGQAGQAIAFSGLFAVVTSLFGNPLLATLNRRSAVIGYTLIMIASGLIITFSNGYVMFMAGRALIGIAIGGFWSLSTAILARIVEPGLLSRAIAMLQSGTAIAFVVAPPLGSFLGNIIGWRGAFFVIVPIGLLCLLFQIMTLPSLPAKENTAQTGIKSLVKNRLFTVGMIAVTLVFMGQFALSTYMRPFLETVTHLSIDGISAYLLAIGIAGFIGTSSSGLFLKERLFAPLFIFQVILAIVVVALILFGHQPIAVAALLIIWGGCVTPIPVVWNTWMSQVIPDNLEAGGSLMVALIQLAITLGAFAGGELFDHSGWIATFSLSAALILISAMIGASIARKTTA